MNRFLSVAFLLAVTIGPAIAQQGTLTLDIRDVDSGQPIAARVYLQDESGKPYFFESAASEGTAFRYEKENWINKKAREFHTTVSAHQCVAELPPGKYELTVEHGKSYHPYHQKIEVAEDDVEQKVSLRRWVEMSQRGWYSGDTHLHRTVDELRNIVMAEDLNVVFPLTYWVTLSDTPPSAGDKNTDSGLPAGLVKVDTNHVIWPRNTEYEIFSVAQQQHTLGALFVLGHDGVLNQTVPPWQPVVAAARASDPDVIFDMDKLAWPFAMVLPTIAPEATYELANNHMWRTEFAFREWYTPTTPAIQPPFGGTEGGERDWVDFTLGMYYALLNCGFRLPPSAGTANGVHPVPAGFGRVYVHQPDGFDYADWKRGLRQGRSFVTTGPMLLATASGHDPGHLFQVESVDAPTNEITIEAEVLSEQPITFGELIIDGRPEVLLRVQNTPTEHGAYRSVIRHTLRPQESGWMAIRVWEDRPEGRFRFAHTAPWYVEVAGQPVRPRQEEKDYLVRRMKDEIQRSRGVVSAAGLTEYEQALAHYQSLDVRDDSDEVARNARPLGDQERRDQWLENMIVHHRFTPHEVRLATGLSMKEAVEEVSRRRPRVVAEADPPPAATDRQLRLLPYPGGRHPRRGFLDGALDPQRETKVSIFPPWPNGGYAVVDVPEAVFSNLGLTYLAHRHIPTIWTEKSVDLEPIEWERKGQSLSWTRRFPNGIVLGSQVQKRDGGVAMQMSLTNQTDQPLTGLRSQVCVMLKGLVGFNTQWRRPEVTRGDFVAVRADDSDRWLITAWRPLHRGWTNPPVPCVHADPIFPDCDPGQTVRVHGALWFYEGEDIAKEIDRLEHSAIWDERPSPK